MLVSSQPYEYDQLPPGNVFRYMELLPGAGDAPLKCNIHTAPIAETKFMALSYVWGSSIRSHTVYSEKHAIKVTQNLHNALHHLRLPDRPLTIWADSICINQISFEEKAHQVALMGTIYRAAERVSIFLGLDADGKGPAVSNLVNNVNQMIQDARSKVKPGWDTFPYPSGEDPIMYDESWAHLRTLLSQSWFDRGWVVQEAALARHGEVIWGQSSFDWDALMRTYLWLSTRGADIYHEQDFGEVQINAHTENYIERHQDVAKLFYNELSWEPPSLLRSLNSAKELDLSNAHDRIYAFMDLPGRGLAMYPEYDRSHLETYYQFAVNYVESTKTAEILDYVNHGNCPPNKIPSWVPHWDVSTWSLSCSCPASTSMKPRGGNSTEPAIIDLKTDVLKVQGIIMDNVYYVSDVFEWDSTTPETFLTVWNHVTKSTIDCPYTDPETGASLLLDAFLDALSAGRLDGEFLEWRKERLLFAHEAGLDFEGIQDKTTPDDAMDGASGVSGTYFSFIRGRTHNRRFVLTERGYMGLAPAVTQVDDTCAIVFGCRLPCVLRRREGVHAYSFLGSTALMAKDCYEPNGGNGVMFCDLLGEDDSRDWEDWDVKEQMISLL